MFTDVEIEARGATLTARDYGGNGSPLVLVHGLSSNVCIWDLAGPALALAHRVVAYDQRSHGLSSDGDGDYSFSALAVDLRAVIDHFRLEEPVVVGHSWGASVALQHAATDHSCPGVVCVDGGVIDMQGLGSSWEQAEELLRPPKLIGPAEKVLARIKREQSLGPIPWEQLEPVVLRGRVADGDVTRPRLRFDDHMKIVHELWAQHVWDVYADVTCPVMLVLAGDIERDEREQGFVAIKKLSVERLLERKPDVRVEWLASVHDIPLANPDELVALVDDFVSRLP